MNEGLLAIKRLMGEGRCGCYDEQDVIDDTNKAMEYLECLEIIIVKEVDFALLAHTSTLQTYNDLIGSEKRQLTEKEYSDLMEIFEE